ncbi:MAG: hydantoinase B/oxoprolinase family protein [Thermaurantiacus sp.]|uniref:hydantoinase B/oxoprolinase family protein n=1 Tax=Thermaurantiacus sp. TaxID=2820283 RepID=UPI00298F1656|nr:hydantoinase B/oxoprolinase family protein [Thermaurantiacus sp.]MDW8414728.1 hydantoinase B/oxoprolinase family protein [Thermaurantiacus sp.]
MSERPLEVWVDRGGTFTDLLAWHPDGRVERLKLPSHDPSLPTDAALRGIRRLSAGHQGPLVVKMGTTVATNALLERTAEPVLLMVTRGFEDLPLIRHQARPDIFALRIERPAPLFTRVVGVRERVAADGTVLVPLDDEECRALLAAAWAEGLRSVAIVLLHGFRFPTHERRLAELARAVGFTHVAVGHEVLPRLGYLARLETTVADAALGPVVRRHVDALAHGLPQGSRLFLMQSSGGLAEASAFRGCQAVLSGPAGGVVGMAAAGRAAGFDRLIGLDMGGTSTDVSRFAGDFERRPETEVAGLTLGLPMLDVHTIAAGGGSICRLEAGRLVVGPASAGAVPGPACYGRSGPLTVTDCNLALGRLDPDAFPAVFGPSGDRPVDPQAARAALERLADEVARETGERPDPLALAEDLVAIADRAMAEAIRRVSLARGHDPATHALVAFGGAGGQHACALADALGMPAVVIPPDAGLLSAFGIGVADLVATEERPLLAPLTPQLEPVLVAEGLSLAAAARAALAAQGIPLADVRVEVCALVRTQGGDTLFAIPAGTASAMREAFTAAHRARFGFADPEAALVVDRLEAVATGRPPGALHHRWHPRPGRSGGRERRVAMVVGGRRHAAPVVARDALIPGDRVAGPALVVEDGATTVVPPGWEGRLHPSGSLVLSRCSAQAAPRPVRRDAHDPARLELMGALFREIATRMGIALQASARSLNIRERLDFSCAVFDPRGRLVANAPHIPVHLGSMGASVARVLELSHITRRPLADGDVFALNAPWAGGTHLPDITVVRPVFLPGVAGPAAFVAARGHHADVGGITPGSMPADSRRIEEEGVVLDGLLVCAAGRWCEAEVRQAFLAGPWPARAPETNLADLAAQVAACAQGARALAEAAAEHGVAELHAAMAAIQDNAAEAVARLVARLTDGSAEAPMDEGPVVRVAIRVDRARRRLVVDFAGTSAQHAGNLNAPPAVTRAALLYVLRCLVGQDMPLNDGCLRPVDLRIPRGSLLDPAPGAAVAGGNVETSQVVTDALLAAFGALAASAGTMSNLSFGHDRHQYYETVAGGSGAGPGFAGTPAVQVHMTNSRLTDPEMLEWRLPIRVEEHRIRRGSGGAGRWPGGDGAVRRLTLLEPMTVSVLSNRRRTRAFGLEGGGDGAAGANRWRRADGTVVDLGPAATVAMAAGDQVEIATPGGGGWGAV